MSRSVKPPDLPLTATTGTEPAASGIAVTQMPPSAALDGPRTVPVIVPSVCSAALMPVVVWPTVIVTLVAVACVGWLLYHCGARPVGPKKHDGSLNSTW